MAAFLHAKLRQKGVRLHLGCTVEGFAANGDRVNVLLKNEAPLTADMVVLAIGVTPDTGLAKAAGLELGIKGSILVNDRMETSAPDIYAVGDAVQVKHFVTGQTPSSPWRPRQQAGAHRGGQHLRRRQPVSRLPGQLRHQGIRYDHRHHRRQ